MATTQARFQRIAQFTILGGTEMPKISNTRKERAAELYGRLLRGPTLSNIGADPFTPERATADVRRWLDSWITPEVLDLVPELKKAEVIDMINARKTGGNG